MAKSFLKFCLSGKIFSNLVTLLPTYFDDFQNKYKDKSETFFEVIFGILNMKSFEGWKMILDLNWFPE